MKKEKGYRNRSVLYIALCFFLFSTINGFSQIKKEISFSVLQLNLWHGGTKVPDGFEGIVGVLEEADADVVFLCETQDKLVPRALEELKKRGKYYHELSLGISGTILSKIEPDSFTKACIIPGDEHRAMLKAIITIGGQPISFYANHLDYRNYECYLPRGYSGTTWEKIDAPITDEAIVLEANRKSYRDESIRAFIEDAQKEIEKGHCVIMGGDFNEPSHLDWQANTKDLFDHNGAIINWDCSSMLQKAGFKDTFREIYPDPVKNPGFTFPAGNKLADEAKLEKLAWAPEVDERDRIDFIYYYPTNPKLSLQNSMLVGPSETVVRNQIVENDSEDKFFTPKSVWPTDHKGNIAIFRLVLSGTN